MRRSRRISGPTPITTSRSGRRKHALAGVVEPVTAKYVTPLMVASRYSSLSFLYGAAETITSIGKPTYIYHLGDHVWRQRR
jgi:hypothetical protein